MSVYRVAMWQKGQFDQLVLSFEIQYQWNFGGPSQSLAPAFILCTLLKDIAKGLHQKLVVNVTVGDKAYDFIRPSIKDWGSRGSAQQV